MCISLLYMSMPVIMYYSIFSSPVEPDHLSAIFSINGQDDMASVFVNGTGPGLDANGTSGTVTVLYSTDYEFVC